MNLKGISPTQVTISPKDFDDVQKTIAEGVETIEQHKLLKELNCDQIQGFVISLPLTANKLVDFVLENKNISDISIVDD